MPKLSQAVPARILAHASPVRRWNAAGDQDCQPVVASTASNAATQQVAYAQGTRNTTHAGVFRPAPLDLHPAALSPLRSRQRPAELASEVSGFRASERAGVGKVREEGVAPRRAAHGYVWICIAPRRATPGPPERPLAHMQATSGVQVKRTSPAHTVKNGQVGQK